MSDDTYRVVLVDGQPEGPPGPARLGALARGPGSLRAAGAGVVICEICHVEVDLDERHDGHPVGCEGPICTCDVAWCPDCCPECHPCTVCKGTGTVGICDHDTLCSCISWECPDCAGTGSAREQRRGFLHDMATAGGA